MKRVPLFDPDFWLRFWTVLTDRALHSLIQIVGLVLIYVLLRLLLLRVVDSLLAGLLNREARGGMAEERIGRLKTLQGLFRSVVSYALFFVFAILALQAIGFEILPFITTASVLGVAIALGSQKLFKDVISGFFLIVDNLFGVGDTVTIGGITGTVQEIGVRVTRLLDASGRLHLFSNGDIGTVANMSRYPVEDFIEIVVDAKADLNTVVATLNKAGDALFAAEGENHLKAAPGVSGMAAFSLLSVTVRVSVLSDPHTLVQEQMRVRQAMRDALLKAEIPLA